MEIEEKSRKEKKLFKKSLMCFIDWPARIRNVAFFILAIFIIFSWYQPLWFVLACVGFGAFLTTYVLMVMKTLGCCPFMRICMCTRAPPVKSEDSFDPLKIPEKEVKK